LEQAVASTDGYSFAEIEELKNLLVMHFHGQHHLELGLGAEAIRHQTVAS